MPSTHLSLHYHLVFSTKGRIPYMQKNWRHRLHAYLGGIVNDLGGAAETIGGVEDHVHLLIGLRATHRLADAMKEIKVASSKWVHREIGNPTFSWQEGYGAFTVGPSQVDVVRQYIAKQEAHHQRRTFQQEYQAFLEQAGVPYDERYLW